MNYRMGTVARIIGTSKEAIRFFEKKNCISEPKRDGAGYRVYDPLQLSVLRWFRLYRAFGFSMQDAAYLVNVTDDAQRQEMLSRGIEQLQERRRQLERCEDELRAMIHDTCRSEEEKRRIAVETCPKLYRISYESGEKLRISGKNGAALAVWTENMPFVKYTVLFHRRNIEAAGAVGPEACVPLDYGLGVFENEILGWEPEKHGAVEVYPAHQYLTTWISTPVTYAKFASVFAYMDEHGLEQDGEIFSRSSEFKRDGETAMPLISCKFYIPFKKL